MKRITAFALMILVATLTFGQGTPIPSMTQAQIDADLAAAEKSLPPDQQAADRRFDRAAEIMAAVDYGFCGALLGLAAGSSIPLWQNQTMTSKAIPAIPASSVTTWQQVPGSTTQGIWVTTPIPASPAVPPVFSPTANPWVEAGGVIAGAALSVGIYELGHRVLRWW